MKTVSNKKKRIALFLIGCIGVRSALVWLAYAYPAYLPLMGIVAIAPAIGFLTIYLGDLRKTGPEVVGDRIWWNNLRPIHGFLYGLFAYMALNQDNRAWIVLLIDVMIGFIAFTSHHLHLRLF
jgi:hypothetical protein